ncbi:group II intron maturase-specific domain-containing protein [Ideonella margarita]|uniref:group II intron maturase-specific domain-containing protein n=1 Tax=Ideonella margarita TaxID=2984191 RepID=UPI003BFA1592
MGLSQIERAQPRPSRESSATLLSARRKPLRPQPLAGYRLHKLGQYVRGWTAYFGISEYYRPVPELDDWIRRRMRMCYWKQWRWPRTKIRHFLAQGVSLKTAIQHGVSTRAIGIWREPRRCSKGCPMRG